MTATIETVVYLHAFKIADEYGSQEYADPRTEPVAGWSVYVERCVVGSDEARDIFIDRDFATFEEADAFAVSLLEENPDWLFEEY